MNLFYFIINDPKKNVYVLSMVQDGEGNVGAREFI